MQAAGFLRRVLALIYDSLVIVGIVLFLTLVLVFFNGSYAESGSFASFLQFFIVISGLTKVKPSACRLGRSG